jgi:hypothetical protein
MPITPDVKDWTWVLDRPCPECGFDAARIAGPEVADAVGTTSATWRSLIDHHAAPTRPTDHRWSAHEYACHVRDVLRLGSYRIGLMLEHDEPTFENWDQDETAELDGYATQDPAAVVVDLEAAEAALTDLLRRVPDDGWSRAGTRTDGARFTVDSFARYLLHDVVHHVWDVEQGYALLSSSVPPSS